VHAINNQEIIAAGAGLDERNRGESRVHSRHKFCGEWILSSAKYHLRTPR
jgi:hypothetical protein